MKESFLRASLTTTSGYEGVLDGIWVIALENLRINFTGVSIDIVCHHRMTQTINPRQRIHHECTGGD